MINPRLSRTIFPWAILTQDRDRIYAADYKKSIKWQSEKQLSNIIIHVPCEASLFSGQSWSHWRFRPKVYNTTMKYVSCILQSLIKQDFGSQPVVTITSIKALNDYGLGCLTWSSGNNRHSVIQNDHIIIPWYCSFQQFTEGCLLVIVVHTKHFSWYSIWEKLVRISSLSKCLKNQHCKNSPVGECVKYSVTVS